MAIKNLHHLALALCVFAAVLLTACGVLTEDNFPGCESTGSKKTYRGIGCQRHCKAEYSYCTNGKNADPDNDCQCTRQPIYLGDLTQVPDTIAGSCACWYPGNPDYVNLHIAGSCPAWLPYLKDGKPVVGLGRSIGLQADNICTKGCTDNGGRELQGSFYLNTRASGGTCMPEATLFPVTVLADYVSGGQLVQGQPREALARAEARLERLQYLLATAGLGPRTMTVADTGALATVPVPTFKMRALGIDCRAECAKSGEMCSSFQVDPSNARGIAYMLSQLPAPGSSARIVFADLAMGAFGKAISTACTHSAADFDTRGRVRAVGNSCDQQLYMRFGSVSDFDVVVQIPSLVQAQFSNSGEYRYLEFDNESNMPRLQIKPIQLQRLYGGRVRAIAADPQRLTLETQNSCIAIKLP